MIYFLAKDSLDRIGIGCFHIPCSQKRAGFYATKRDEVKAMGPKTTANRVEGRVKTLDEVASLLRISRGSAYEAAKRKEIPTIRIGRRLLVPSDALEKLLSGNTGR